MHARLRNNAEFFDAYAKQCLIICYPVCLSDFLIWDFHKIGRLLDLVNIGNMKKILRKSLRTIISQLAKQAQEIFRWGTAKKDFFLWRCGPTRSVASHSWIFYITHNDPSQSVGLLWTSDQLVAETSTWQHTTLTTDKHPCHRWDLKPRSQQASGRRYRH